jgi:thymidylate synthase
MLLYLFSERLMIMYKYKALISKILSEGVDKSDRTGTGTRSIFGHQEHFDMVDGFPIVTIKHTAWKSVVTELLWFMAGRTDVKYLQDNGCKIWNEWVLEDGTIGKGYGYQWRNFGGVDQLQNAIDMINNTPDSRRIIVSAWNPAELSEMALPPCHMCFQFVVNGNNLDLHLLQRSCDVGLGVPFNWASYSLMLHIIAKMTGYNPGTFVWTGVDVHLYNNSMNQMAVILNRKPYPLPKLVLPEWLTDSTTLEQFTQRATPEDFTLEGYRFHPKVIIPVAV